MAATIEVFVRGNKIIVRATWKIETVAASEDYNLLADPTAVTFTARQRLPSGQVQAAVAFNYPSAEVAKVSVGIYEFAHIPTAGRWFIHAQGTGTAHGSGRVTYDIDESEALAA